MSEKYVVDMQEEAERLYKASENMTVQDLGSGYRLELGRRVFKGDEVVADFGDERDTVTYKGERR